MTEGAFSGRTEDRITTVLAILIILNLPLCLGAIGLASFAWSEFSRAGLINLAICIALPFYVGACAYAAGRFNLRAECRAASIALALLALPVVLALVLIGPLSVIKSLTS